MATVLRELLPSSLSNASLNDVPALRYVEVDGRSPPVDVSFVGDSSQYRQIRGKTACRKLSLQIFPSSSDQFALKTIWNLTPTVYDIVWLLQVFRYVPVRLERRN